MVAETDPLEEANASNIATVRDAKHLLHAREAKEDQKRLADCSGGDAATLGLGNESEAEFSGQSIGRQKHADVADELIGCGIGDPELEPIAGCEQRCLAHLGEERQSFSLGHGRPALEAAEFRKRSIRLEGRQVTRSQATKPPAGKRAWQLRGTLRVHDG